MVRVVPEKADFHGRHFDEASRLTRGAEGALEPLRTQELPRARLSAPSAAVLDVGGGAGVHARWLTADGYQVHLVDPVARDVAAAPAARRWRGSAR